MARQPDYPHVVTEIFAAELRADAEALRQFVNFGLEREIAERVAVLAASRRQPIVIVGRAELDGLQSEFRRSSANDDGEMIGRAGRSAERQDFFLEKVDQPVMRQERGSPLKQVALIGGAAAFRHE